MTVVEARVEIEAPPEEVWRVVSDPRNLPLWDSHVVSVRDVPQEGVSEGTEYRTDARFFGFTVSVTARVLQVRAPEYAKVRLSGVIEGIVETWVEPLQGSRSRLRHSVQYRFRGGAMGRVAARAVRMLGARAMLRRGTLSQKRQIESG
ncbi:hypothetical protein BH20ACT24_BH20ACT24_19020 [soil metagenome]